MEHSHSKNTSLHGKRIFFVAILNFLITAAQIVGGLISNSLSLVSDAIHNLGDSSALLTAYLANRIGQRTPTPKHTFGMKRIEILAAFFNALILIVISVFLFIEAFHRFLNPEPIKGLIMFIVAFIGLIANFLSVLILHKDSAKNINIKAAYIHLLGDTLSSIAVIIGALAIYFFDIFWLDPLITFIVGLYIIYHAVKIVKQTIEILMQFTPTNLDVTKIKSELEIIHGLSNIHHIHVWNLTDSLIHFECHVDLNKDIALSQTQKYYEQIKVILHDKFEIDHVTIQFEYNCCTDKSLIYKNISECVI